VGHDGPVQHGPAHIEEYGLRLGGRGIGPPGDDGVGPDHRHQRPRAGHADQVSPRNLCTLVLCHVSSPFHPLTDLLAMTSARPTVRATLYSLHDIVCTISRV